MRRFELEGADNVVCDLSSTVWDARTQRDVENLYPQMLAVGMLGAATAMAR